MDKRWVLVVLFALLGAVNADDGNLTALEGYNQTDGSFPFDPILKYRPSFACSLPVQILMTGIVLTLTSVLLIHLMFTAQYHWPLAPVNYALQVSAVCTLLTSLIATLHLVLQDSTNDSRQWPYMLNYIAVDIPPLRDNTGWSSGELAAWLLMNAATSALIQITHIQFLTLLFPSTVERRLIFILLGPLAIVAAIMQLVPLGDPTIDGPLTSIATAVQNVCNATLSLLFTGSLFIWGFLVNRKSAWRTDGGTAAFGVGAMVLAVGSTTITFIYIPSKDHYDWMPGLMWSVILWQSFLGWWWWVGAGMGVGEVDELLRREEKRKRKRRAKAARREMRRGRYETFWKGVAGAVGYRVPNGKPGELSMEREGAASGSASEEHQSSSDQERGRRSWSRLSRIPSQQSGRSGAQTNASALSNSNSNTTTATSSGFFGRVKSHVVVRCVYGWYLLLRHAHLIAAREQAVEHGERIQQVYRHEVAERAAMENPDPATVGWGLGSFGIRQMDGEGQRDAEAFQGILEEDRIRMRREAEEIEEVVREKTRTQPLGKPPLQSGARRKEGPRARTEPQMEEDEVDIDAGARRRRTRHARRDTDAAAGVTADATREQVEAQPSSMWYWGPLRRWRLQDSTVYS